MKGRCKDCIHFGICKKGFPWADGKGGGWCEDFKSKADLVEVVRCKDCKRWRENWIIGVPSGVCIAGKPRRTAPNDFCSYGERKDNV